MNKVTQDQSPDPMFNDSGFMVSLGRAAHQQAEQFLPFHQQHPALAKQVYLNALAVYAANYYLHNCLEFDTDLSQSDSANPVMQVLANVADLQLNGLGRVECRVVLPGETAVRVPMEVWDDRIAYIAVQVNQELTEATLVGFLPAIAAEEVPLSEWHTLEELLIHLEGVAPNPAVAGAAGWEDTYLATATIAAHITHLSQWLQNQVEPIWQTLDELFNAAPQVAHGWRSPSRMDIDDFNDPDRVKRAKLLDFAPDTTSEPLALVVGLKPIASPPNRIRPADDIDIWVKVCPLDSQAYLPSDLHVAILNHQGTAVMQVQTVPENGAPRLRFTGKQGEQFSVKIELAQASITETFLI